MRDIIAIRLENTSTTLVPQLTLYNSNKSQLQNVYDGTAGASIGLKLSGDPGEDYYLEVSPFESSSGDYKLSINAQKAYDRYEPNDSALAATPITVGQAIEANIMDAKDVDWYRVSGVRTKSLTVALDNESTSLAPSIGVYDSNRSQIGSERYDSTAGASLKFTVPVESGQDYYLQVQGYEPVQNVSNYRLSVQ
jgi:hypothetical protein